MNANLEYLLRPAGGRDLVCLVLVGPPDIDAARGVGVDDLARAQPASLLLLVGHSANKKKVDG